MGSPWPNERARESRRARNDSPYGSANSERARYRRSRSRSRERRRRTRRSRSRSRDEDSVASSDTAIEDDAFEFTLEDPTVADSASESDIGVSVSAEELKTSGESKHAAAGYSEGEVYNVVESLYTGEGITGGVQQAKLTITRERRPDQSTVYRWVHRTDESMVLKRFETLVDELPGLDNSVRRATTKLFERVRQKFERQLPLSASGTVQEMQPDMIQETVSSSSKPAAKGEKTRQLTWICMPFFLLREYKELKGLNSWEHPMRTILQYRFASARKGRDLQQAVCNLPGTPKDHCFRVGQLWCLILDDSFVATYAPVPRPQIIGDVIKLSDPPKAPHPGERPKKILVSYGRSVLWSFNIEDCPTWFALTKHFTEFWPRRVKLFYGKSELTPALYPKILRRVEQFGSVSLRLDVLSSRSHLGRTKPSLRPAASASDSGIADSDSRAGAIRHAEDGRGTHLSPRALHNMSADSCEYFVLVAAFVGTGKIYSSISDNERTLLSKGLRRMDQFLSRGTATKEWIGYKNSPSSKYSRVLAELQEEEAILSAIPKDDKNASDKQRCYTAQMSLFNNARSLSEFFAPTELDGPTISKYWGAVQTILESYRSVFAISGGRPSRDTGEDYDPVEDYEARKANREKAEQQVSLEFLCEDLEKLAQEFACVKALLSGMRPGSTEISKVPDEFVKSWLHIVIGFTLYNSDKRHDWYKHRDLAEGLIRKGRTATAALLLKTSLTEHFVATPPAVAALIVLRFLRDVTPGDRSILNTYVDYLRLLESRIDEKPLKQDHQVNLARMQEEMESIREILSLQSKVCERMTRALGSGTVQLGQPRPPGITIFNEQVYNDDMYPRRTRAHAPMQYVGPNGELLTPAQPIDYGGAPPVVYNAGRRQGSMQQHHMYSNAYTRQRPEYQLETYDLPQSERKILPTDTRGHQSIIAQDCDRLVKSRLYGFQTLDRHVAELVQSVTMSVTSNRDRQDSAVYAFTIVTIIFLPISTIAGIFGMNTNDVRNMDQNQWLFWAVAVPLWALVMVMCLIWSGEWERFRESRRGGAKSTSKAAAQNAQIQAQVRSFQPTRTFI